MTKEQIIKRLLRDFDEKEEYSKEIYHEANDEKWTLADLMIRQFLNNGCNGFGMVRVGHNYYWLVSIKDELIKYNLVSKNGFNNSGFPLWENYDF
jgi:hypothetical protein